MKANDENLLVSVIFIRAESDRVADIASKRIDAWNVRAFGFLKRAGSRQELVELLRPLAASFDLNCELPTALYSLNACDRSVQDNVPAEVELVGV